MNAELQVWPAYDGFPFWPAFAQGFVVFRLSLIVPAVGQQGSLEETLVSLLTHRPQSCEVVVVCGASYVDQYGLGDEVRFLRVDDRLAKWSSLANAGLSASHGAYTNLVLPGVEVLADWDQAAIDRLQRTSRMGSVSSLMFDDQPEHATVAIAGLDYCVSTPDRRKRLAAQGKRLRLPMRVDGPSASCGFFRRQDLLELGGWDERLPANLADVELAFRLRRQGLASVCDPTSRVILRESAPLQLAHAGARRNEEAAAERMLWSHARQVGIRAWLGYPASWLDLQKAKHRIGSAFQSRPLWTAGDPTASLAKSVPEAGRRAA